MAKFKCNVPGVIKHSFSFKGELNNFETPIIETEDSGLIKFLNVNRNYDIIADSKPAKKTK